MNKMRFMQDMGELLVFGTGLWGVVALLSLLLPVANVVTGTIPLQPQLVQLGTALAVVTAFFAFTYSFTEKSHILDFELRRPFYRGEIVNPRRDMLHNAVSRFAWSMISLTAYIMLTALRDLLQQNSDEAAKWLIPVLDPAGLMLYAATFALATGAFSTLAVMQYARPRNREARMRSVNLGVRDETAILTGERGLSSSPDGAGDTQNKD